MTITLITGNSRGIGKAIHDDLRHFTDHKIIGISSKDVDLYDYNHVYSGIKGMLSCLPCIDIDQINLILCAAQIGTFGVLDLKETDDLYRINLIGNLAVIKAAMELQTPKMRIVWFSGGGAAYAYPDFFAYSLSKVAVVRAVENISIDHPKAIEDFSIIALAPGAVDTDMLKKVVAAGSVIRTRTDIIEPVIFVRKFITDQMKSKSLNGKFLHVRDTLNIEGENMFKLRRTE